MTRTGAIPVLSSTSFPWTVIAVSCEPGNWL